MLVVDAGCLYEALVGTHAGVAVARRLAIEEDLAAPHLIDVEVVDVARRHHLSGRLDRTAALQVVEDLAFWPGERFAHAQVLPRVWELRANVRGWEAFYVALAEALDAPLLTLDKRLARATGPRCACVVPGLT